MDIGLTPTDKKWKERQNLAARDRMRRSRARNAGRPETQDIDRAITEAIVSIILDLADEDREYGAVMASRVRGLAVQNLGSEKIHQEAVARRILGVMKKQRTLRNKVLPVSS